MNPATIGQPIAAATVGSIPTNLPASTLMPSNMAPVPPEQAGTSVGCAMNFAIEEITRLEIKFPWGFLSEEFDVAFIDHEGNLTVASDAPKFNETTNQFVLSGGSSFVVLGKVAQQYRGHWTRSITFRPEVEVVQAEAKPVPEVVEEPVKQPDVIKDTTDWGAASNTKKRKEARTRAGKGERKEDQHPALQAYWPN